MTPFFTDGGPADVAALAATMRGARLGEVLAAAPAWTFVFDEGRTLTVECPWRVRDERSVVLSGADDGQRFGLDRPVNIAEETRGRLVGRRIDDFQIDPATGDIEARFENGLRLETFTESTGYESWQLSRRGDPVAVAIGGGAVRAMREV